MKFEQYVGPFTSNTLILNKRNVTYLQIGIEHPHSIPLSEIPENNDNIRWPIIVSINKNLNNVGFTQKDYIITENDILEFELNHDTVDIIIHKNENPYLIINVAYEDAN